MSALTMVGYVLTAHDAYVTCALWSSTCLDGHDVAMESLYDADDIAPDSRLFMLRDVVDFVADNLDTIRTTPAYMAGHLTESARSVGQDLWLTRNRQSTGFWDRGLGVIGDHLTEAAQAMGTSGLYVGDDGRVRAS